MKVNNVYDLVNSGISVVGLSVSVGDLTNTINLILLIISILNLLVNCVLKIVHLYKTKGFKDTTINDADKTVKDTIDGIRDLLSQGGGKDETNRDTDK